MGNHDVFINKQFLVKSLSVWSKGHSFEERHAAVTVCRDFLSFKHRGGKLNELKEIKTQGFNTGLHKEQTNHPEKQKTVSLSVTSGKN